MKQLNLKLIELESKILAAQKYLTQSRTLGCKAHEKHAQTLLFDAIQQYRAAFHPGPNGYKY